ncbi:MAG: type II secretion system F family protein [Victivallales bacterium]|nr:type II secretion system F family protein [Victivallales bacterium]
MEWEYTIIIFLSASVFAFLVLDMLVRYLQEALELHRNPRYEELRRFVEPRRLLLTRVFGAMAVACVAFLLQLACGVEKMAIAVPVAVGFGVLAWRLVYLYYHQKLVRRKEAFESKILDLAMGLSNAMHSGLSLGQAVESVAHRIGDPMREELETLLQEYRLNVGLPEAFQRLYQRMPCEDLHILATAIALTTRSGGSLAEVLEEIVDTIRKRTEFQGRLKNMTAAGRFEALMISCAPLACFVLLFLIDPSMMRPVVTTGTGWLAVGGACVLVGIGYSVLKKIITIEV